MALKDERNVDLLDYSGAVNQLRDIAKRELEDVRNQILLENSNLSQLRDRIIKGQNDFESWKRQEASKFNNEMNKVKNDIFAKQNEINIHVEQQQRITTDLQTQQQRFENLNVERIALKEEYVKLEGKKISIQDMLKEAEKIKSESLNQSNNVSAVHQKALEIQEKNKQENIRLVNLNDALEQTRKKIEEDTKSLQELKEFVDPKIRSIKDEQDFLDRSKQENQDRIDEINRKINEEKVLLQSVQDKKMQFDKEYKDFLSQREEFSRQQTLSKPLVADGK